MTIQEYKDYSDITIKLFNYMNGRINVLNNNCILQICPYDLINNTYGKIRHPNLVFIHVGTIVDSWDDSWSIYMNKQDYVGSCIAWAISHELHHVDQLMSMIMYNRNDDYRKEMEADVERASYDWVHNNRTILSEIGGFNVLMNQIYSPSLPDNGHYTKASVKEFYLQTIANIIIRDLDLFESLRVFTNDTMCDDMILVFNNIDTIVIKSNGIFLKENTIAFSKLVHEYCSRYDLYHIYVDISFGYNSNNRCIATVQFQISGNLIYPMQFK